MKNSFTLALVTMVLVGLLGFASNRKLAKNNAFSGQTSPSSSIHETKVEAQVRAAKADFNVVDRLDGFSKDGLYRRTSFSCSGSDCCCSTASGCATAKCLPPQDCKDIGGTCGGCGC